MIILNFFKGHLCSSFCWCKYSIFLSSKLDYFLHGCIYRPCYCHCVDPSLCLITYKLSYYHPKERSQKYKRHCHAYNFIVYRISLRIFRVFLLEIHYEPKDSCNDCYKRRDWHSLLHIEPKKYEHYWDITSCTRNSSCVWNCNHQEHYNQATYF